MTTLFRDKKIKRPLATLLALVVCLGVFQFNALASEDEAEDDSSVSDNFHGGSGDSEISLLSDPSGGGETLSATQAEDDAEADTGDDEEDVFVGIKAEDVTVSFGDSTFDLMNDVRARNEAGEALTVVVSDDGGFDIHVIGEYTVTYQTEDGVYNARRIVTIVPSPFPYDKQPASAQEVLDIVESFNNALESLGEDDELPALPKWKEAVDADWLPLGWTQIMHTDPDTGAVYWSLQIGAMSISPFLAPVAGDIDVAFDDAMTPSNPTNYHTYDTYTSSAGAAPSTLDVPLRITVQVQNLTDAAIVVPIDCNIGHNIGLIAGETAAKYFDYSTYNSADANVIQMVDSVTSDGTQVTIKLKDNIPIGTSCTVYLSFAYNTQYNRAGTRVAPHTTENPWYLWDNISAQVVVASTSTPVGAVVNGGSVRTTAQNNKPISWSRLNPTTANATQGSFMSLRVHLKNNYYYQASQNYPTTLTLKFPKSITNFTTLAGFTQDNTDPANTILRRTFTSDETAGGWSTKDNTSGGKDTGSWFQADMVFELPATYPLGTNNLTVSAVYEYSYVGDYNAGGTIIQRSTPSSISYSVVAPLAFDYYCQTTHTTGWDAQYLSVSGLDTSDYSDRTVYALGYSAYGNGINSKNQGASPVKNMKLTLNNSTHTTHKLNFYRITLGATKEASTTGWTQYAYTINFHDGHTISGTYAPSGTATHVSTFIFSNDADELAHGYITSVEVVPMGASALVTTQQGQLLPKNGFYLSYTIQGWSGKQWPNGSPMVPYTEVQNNWTLTYLDETNSSFPVTQNKTGRTFSHYYAEKGVAALAQMVKTDAATTKQPGQTLDYEIQGFSNPYHSAASTGGQYGWIQPQITIRVEKHLTMNSWGDVTLTDQGGGTGTTANVEVDNLGSDGNYNYIRFRTTTPYATSRAALVRFKIPITFLIDTSALAGSYTIPAVVVSSGDTSQVVHTSGSDGVYPSTDTGAQSFYNLSTHYYFVNSKSATEAVHDGYTIGTVVGMTPSTQIHSLKNDPSVNGGWTSDPISGADFEETVQVKLLLSNGSNIAVNDIKLYDIVPYSGYNVGGTQTCTGQISFQGVDDSALPAASTVYYYVGSNPPALTAITTIDPINDADWYEASALVSNGYTLDDVTAFYVDYGTPLAAGASLEIIMKFKTPDRTKPPQVVYNLFQYMYTPNDGTGVSKNSQSSVHGFSTLYLFVVYQPNDVTQGGPGSTKADAMPAGTDALKGAGEIRYVTTDIPKRPGYTFVGWNSLQNGTGITYSASDPLVMDSLITNMTDLETYNLYAQWTPNVYTLYFDKNGGSQTSDPNPTSKKVTFDTAIGTLPKGDNAPHRSNATFMGWVRVTTPPKYEEVFETDIWTYPGDQTVYALWLKYPNEPNGGIYEGPDMDRIESNPWPLGEDALLGNETNPAAEENALDNHVDNEYVGDDDLYNPETGGNKAGLFEISIAACLTASAFFTLKRKKKKK